MRTQLRTAAVVAPVVVLLAACGGGGSGTEAAADVDFAAAPTGALSAWAFDNADDVGQARLDHAEETLSDVDVTLDPTGFDAQKMTTRLASGQVPDVVQMDRRFVATYAAQGVIMPLDACYEAQDVVPDERFYPFVVDDVRYQDQVWAVPQFFQPPAILLNMRVMEAAGVTPEEIDTSKPDVLLAAIAKMAQVDGGSPSLLGFDPVATGQAPLWVVGTGGRLTDEEGRPTLDDPANTAGLELLKQIVDAQGGFAAVKSFSDSFDTFGDANPFVADQVGSQVAAQWYPNVLASYVGQVDLQAVPFRDPEGQPFALAGGTAFVIPTAAKNPGAACAWLMDITSPEAWEAAGAARAASREADGGFNTGLLTGSPEVDQALREEYVVPTGDAGFDQVIDTYYSVLDSGISFGASPAGQEIQSELTNAVTSYLLGEKSVDDALGDAQDAAVRAYDSVTADAAAATEG